MPALSLAAFRLASAFAAAACGSSSPIVVYLTCCVNLSFVAS